MNTKTIITVVSVASMLSFGCAKKERTPSSEVNSPYEIPAEVITHMKSAGQALATAKAFKFKAASHMDEVLENGELVSVSRQSEVVVKRPDRFRINIDGGDVSWDIWYDGKTITLLDRVAKEAGAIDAPSTIDETLDFVVEKYGLTIPLSDLLYSDMDGSMLKNVETAQYLGLGNVDKDECHHLKFKQDIIDWEIWIDSGEQAVPRKFVITYKKEKGNPQYSTILSDWVLAADILPKTFLADIPENVKNMSMDEFFEMTEEESENNEK